MPSKVTKISWMLVGLFFLLGLTGGKLVAQSQSDSRCKKQIDILREVVKEACTCECNPGTAVCPPCPDCDCPSPCPTAPKKEGPCPLDDLFGSWNLNVGGGFELNNHDIDPLLKVGIERRRWEIFLIGTRHSAPSRVKRPVWSYAVQPASNTCYGQCSSTVSFDPDEWKVFVGASYDLRLGKSTGSD